jgi:hypothetical protein
MTPEQELKAKLEVAQSKRRAIFDDIESLRRNEEKADKEIAEILADIEAAKKPKLRHGDYGFGGNWESSTNENFIYTEQTDGGKAFYESGMGQINVIHSKHSVFGNIFDDLKASQEDVTEFKVKDIDGDTLTVRNPQEDKCKCFLLSRIGIRLDSDGLDELILKLRQMQAEIKRNEL